MAVKRSAGILAYRLKNGFLEVFLGHPGGPFNARRDLGVWSIPKGEFVDEKPLNAAKREFAEETGFKVSGKFVELLPVKQRSGKIVYAWALETDIDAAAIISNTFLLEFPKGSRRGKEYPELDRAEWFDIDTASQKILAYQLPFLAQLGRILRESEAASQP